MVDREPSSELDPYENYHYVVFEAGGRQVMSKKFPDVEDGKHTANYEPPERFVTAARDFEDLDKIIDALGEVEGSDGTKYNAADLKDAIGQFRHGAAEDTVITRELGLRDKVVELAGHDTKA